MVTNVWAIEWLIQAIGGPLVRTEEFESTAHQKPTEADLARLREADVVIYLGNLSKDAKELLDGRAKDDPVRFRDVGSVTQMRFLVAPPELKDDRLPANVDPHVWLDPDRMLELTNTIQTALRRAAERRTDLPGQPASRAAELGDRAKAVRETLGRLISQMHNDLADCHDKLLVAEHPAYGYLASTFKLIQFPVTRLIPGRLPEAEESAQRQRLADRWRSERHKAIFLDYGKGFGRDIARDEERLFIHTLADEFNARELYLFSLEETPEQLSGEPRGYVEAMEENVRMIQLGLGC